jgi:hypothetical protein
MKPPPYLAAPGPPAGPPRERPAQALRALAGHLTRTGTTRLYGHACSRYGVLSIRYGLTVWTNGRIFWWRNPDGTETTWPAADPSGAARRLTAPSQASGPQSPNRT